MKPHVSGIAYMMVNAKFCNGHFQALSMPSRSFLRHGEKILPPIQHFQWLSIYISSFRAIIGRNFQGFKKNILAFVYRMPLVSLLIFFATC